MNLEENFSPGESEISDQAFEWMKKNKTLLIEKFASDKNYSKDELPTTLFMAGSPGAGKTEVSRRLVQNFKQKPVIVDTDEIREIIDGYKGKNAYLFQKGATKGVHILFDHCRHKNLNLILDGTFAYERALDNVLLSLKRKRNIEIYFIYQDPVVSWEFTKERELRIKRNVPKPVFIDSYLKSIVNAGEAKRVYGKDIKLNIVIKNFERDLEKLFLNVDEVANYLPKLYTEEELESILH